MSNKLSCTGGFIFHFHSLWKVKEKGDKRSDYDTQSDRQFACIIN